MTFEEQQQSFDNMLPFENDTVDQMLESFGQTGYVRVGSMAYNIRDFYEWASSGTGSSPSVGDYDPAVWHQAQLIEWVKCLLEEG